MKTLRVLTVDDSKFNRELVIKTLRHTYPEIEIMEAADGRKAQTLIKNHDFDLILCDWEMPEMTGLALLEWVRQESELKDRPFIMVTSLDKKEHVVQALKAGVNDYITKPFSAEQLLSKVVKQLVGSGAVTEKELASMGIKPRIVSAGGAELLAGMSSSAAAAKPVSKPRNYQSKALLWGQGDKFAVALKELSQQRAVILARRDAGLPALGEQVQLGLIGGSDERPVKVVVRGFIQLQQLAEKSPAASNLILHVLLPPQKGEVAEQLQQLLG